MENKSSYSPWSPNQKNNVNAIHTATHLPQKVENVFLIMANQNEKIKKSNSELVLFINKLQEDNAFLLYIPVLAVLLPAKQ